MTKKLKKSLVFPFASLILTASAWAHSTEPVKIIKSNEIETIDSVKASTPYISDDVARTKLLKLLSKVTSFSASFEQGIYDEEGNALQVSLGNITVKKPNLVNWHTQSPDENQIISDGETLWLFDPFIEQVTAYPLDTSLHNTPILLLSSDEPSLWQQYEIEQIAQSEFVIKSKDDNSQVKALTIVFAEADNTIKEFIILDATGQRSAITLSAFKLNPTLNEQTFNFTVPEGVHLDDQR